MSIILNIEGRQILDSRGHPTIQVEILTEDGTTAIAAVPSGASTGSHEALELRDKREDYYNGKSVLQAVKNVNTLIKDLLIGADACNQTYIDKAMIDLDGTKNKSKLGANAILGTSLAVCKVAAKCCHQPLYQYIGGVAANTLPTPMLNIINGGAHANNKLNFQEFMIVPCKAKTFSQGVHQAYNVFNALKSILQQKKYTTAVGDEGGFAPDLKSDEQAIELLLEAITKAGYEPGLDIFISLDVASTEMYNTKSKTYRLYKSQPDKELSNQEFVDYLYLLTERYPIISIEDGCSEDDWEGWRLLTNYLGKKCQVVGDDLFVTNAERLKHGINNNIANAILVKINQIGTISETIEVVQLAQRQGYNTIISHRSGETRDTSIADLAVGLNSGQIKTGSLCRSERVEKYNRLMKIESELSFSNYNNCLEKYIK